MRAEGFLVGRPFAAYETWCRVSIGTLPQMEGFAAALRRYAARRAEAAA
jgi:histidinol-phosphate/aromatic aminotransferase/cobyric acid decarboxylase-like protein